LRCAVLALPRIARLRTIAEHAIIAVGINAAFGDETCLAFFEADFTCTNITWGRAGLALARVAGLFAVAVLLVVAVIINDTRDLFAYVVVFTAEKAYTARPCAVLALAINACLFTVAELVVVASVIVGAFGINLAYTVCWITLLTNGTFHGYIGATGL